MAKKPAIKHEWEQEQPDPETVNRVAPHVNGNGKPKKRIKDFRPFAKHRFPKRGTSRAVVIEVSLADAISTSEGHCNGIPTTRRLDITNLSLSQRMTLSRLAQHLDAAGAVVDGHRRVTTQAMAVRWLLDLIAGEAKSGVESVPISAIQLREAWNQADHPEQYDGFVLYE